MSEEPVHTVPNATCARRGTAIVDDTWAVEEGGKRYCCANRVALGREPVTGATYCCVNRAMAASRRDIRSA